MEIQDAKQARPHCELIAELLDSRQPKTEREHAAVREIERLRHDIERHIAIASEHATECERLRAELAEAKRDAERLNFLEVTQTGVYHVTERVRVPATTTDRRWVDEWRFVGWSAALRDDELPTIREAIDAAMAGGEHG